MTPGRRGGIALAAIATVAFGVGVHLALVNHIPPAAGALLCLVPLTGFVLWGLKHPRHRVLFGCGVAAVAAILWMRWDILEAHFPDVFYVEHVGINLALALLFGRTLVGGREPLVGTFARVAHGYTTPALQRYTRRVTIAWTLFFLGMALASTVLYAMKWMAAWSLLVNAGSPTLIALMFLVEYAIRHRVLPDLERMGIFGGIRAFSRHFAARAEAPR